MTDTQTLLLGFRIDDDGNQLVVIKEFFDHVVDYDEFETWCRTHELGAGFYQFDAVNHDSISEFHRQREADMQWYAWKQNEVGRPSVPNLDGAYTNAFVTVSQHNADPMTVKRYLYLWRATHANYATVDYRFEGRVFSTTHVPHAAALQQEN